MSSVSVTLSGRVKSKIVRSNGQYSAAYRECLLLVHVPCDWTGPESKAFGLTGNVSGPFRIEIPDSTQDLRDVMSQNKKTARYGSYWKSSPKAKGYFSESEFGHPLPPTFADKQARFRCNYKCYVEYHLTAEVKTDAQKTPQCEVPIGIMSKPPLPEEVEHMQTVSGVSQQSFTFKSLKFIPGNEFREIGFREKGKSLFKPGATPSFSCVVNVSSPMHLFLGRHISTSISLSDLKYPEGFSMTALLPVTLTQVEFSSHSITSCRTCVKFGRDAEDTCDESKWAWSSSSAELLGEFEPSQNLTKTITGAPIPCRYRPTFTTYCIKTGYALKVKVTLSCGSEEKTYKPIHDVQLHANPGVDQLDGAAEFDLDLKRRSSHDLPRYNATLAEEAAPAVCGDVKKR